MSSLILTALYLTSLILFGLMIRKLYDIYQRKHNNYPPGTNGLPLIGTFIPFIRNPIKYLTSLAKYGDVVMVQIGFRNAIIVNNSSLMFKWLATKELGTYKPNYGSIWNKDPLFLAYHPAVFASGKTSMRIRRQISSIQIRLMNTKFLENMASPYMHSTMFKNINKCIENSTLWNLHSALRIQIFNSMHIGCFGKPMDPNSKDFKIAFEYIDSFMRHILPFIFQSDFYTIGGTLICDKISSFLRHKVLHKKIVSIITGFRQLAAKWTNDYDKNNKYKYIQNKYFNLVVDEYLAQYYKGNISEEELVKVYPTKKIIIGSGIISKLHYLRALIKESLRMFDGSPLNRSRLVTKDTNIILPNGNKMTLPKDSIILCNMYHMNMSCHNQKWHSNTAMNKFDVNRWINKDTNTLDTKLKVHTFGAGKRNCVGQSLAERQLYMFTAEILRNYKLSLPNNAEINIKMNFLKTTQVSPVVVEKRNK